MKALVLDEPGAFGNLHLDDIPQPQPGPAEVRVRVEAVGLNPVDYKLMQGGHPAWRFPFVLGLDVAGVVDAVGDGVDQWQMGDRVFYHGNLARPGGYAEYAIAEAHTIARIPDQLTSVHAAALPCAGITAYQALYRKVHVQSGQIVLVHAGAGGVGGFAVQLAAGAGATVITTCSPANVEFVTQLGAAHTIDYHTEDINERVMAITNGRGVDVILDTIGQKSATDGLEVLAFGGALVCVEALPDLTKWHMFANGISVHEIALGVAHFSNNRDVQEDLARMAEELGALVATGRIDPMVNEVVSLDSVPDALRRLARRHVRGKIVAQL